MSKKIPKPAFDSGGYQTNLTDLNGKSLPDLKNGRLLSREEAKALGVPSPKEAAKMPVVPLHGGARIGAGRKPKGHVRMQILVSPRVRKHIRALARKRKITISGVIEEHFA